MKHTVNPHRKKHILAQEKQMELSIKSLEASLQHGTGVKALIKTHTETVANVELLQTRLDRLTENFSRAQRREDVARMRQFKAEIAVSKKQLKTSKANAEKYRKLIEKNLRK